MHEYEFRCRPIAKRTASRRNAMMLYALTRRCPSRWAPQRGSRNPARVPLGTTNIYLFGLRWTTNTVDTSTHTHTHTYGDEIEREIEREKEKGFGKGRTERIILDTRGEGERWREEERVEEYGEEKKEDR